jgi:hypothetical protein
MFFTFSEECAGLFNSVLSAGGHEVVELTPENREADGTIGDRWVKALLDAGSSFPYPFEVVFERRQGEVKADVASVLQLKLGEASLSVTLGREHLCALWVCFHEGKEPDVSFFPQDWKTMSKEDYYQVPPEVYPALRVLLDAAGDKGKDVLAALG